jgi:uncharacterized protein (UPF0332 family)
MTKPDFLHKLAHEKKLEGVEPSTEMASSYLQKSADSLRSAKILLENGLYDNSVALAYYSMYNALTALLFRVGIKCENHSGSIALLEELFGEPELHNIITLAKKERIDKQYYVKSASNLALTASAAAQTCKEAEDFTVRLRLRLERLNEDEIGRLRERFKRLVG